MLPRDWETCIDEINFKTWERVLFVNHKLKKVELKFPPHPKEWEELYPINDQPHYRSCMASLVKYIEHHNDKHSKLMQLILVQKTSVTIDTSNYRVYEQIKIVFIMDLEKIFSRNDSFILSILCHISLLFINEYEHSYCWTLFMYSVAEVCK